MRTQQRDNAPSAPIWGGIAQFFADYAWFLAKNLIGWILIVASPWFGVLVPGPGGVPLFLVGFALVSFPGKRNLTARIMRGRPFALTRRRYAWICLGGAVVLPTLAFALARWRWREWMQSFPWTGARILATALLAVGLGWVATALGLRVGNWIIRRMPRVRRIIRPWMRRHGINLLPPRRTRRLPGAMLRIEPLNDEILAFHARHVARARSAGRWLKRSTKRGIGVAITALVLVWFARRIHDQWDAISQKVQATSPGRIAVAAIMFALFLLVFRALAWRRILAEFARRIPVWPATRIWSTSELARYLPGAIWQVVGRVYLVRPYGVSGAACSTSQLLELAIFLLANIFTALICLPWFAPQMGEDARPYLYAAAGLAPLLLLLLYPPIFLGVVNRILQAVGKPPFTIRLHKRLLAKLMLWNMFGLGWQGLALWVLMSQPDTLGLRLSQLPLIIGAYSIAWTAGFLAITNPAGLGVREAVLVTILRFSLPESVLVHFGGDERQLKAFLMFLGLLLRLWTIVGEVMLTAVAYVVDYRGAIGRPDAPGRVSLPPDHSGTA